MSVIVEQASANGMPSVEKIVAAAKAGRVAVTSLALFATILTTGTVFAAFAMPALLEAFPIPAAAAEALRQGLTTQQATEVPTIAETGLPEYEATAWFTIGAAAKVPTDIVRKLNTDIDAWLKAPDMQARFQDAGYAMLGGPPQRLHDMMVDGIDRFGTIIKSVGIEPE